MDLTEKTLSTKQVYDGLIVKVRVDTVTLPDGKQARREVVEHPGGVAVFPLNDRNEVVMVRQYRYPVGEITLEIPAGKLEAGEDPAVCAARELAEETGYTGRLIPLGMVYASPGCYGEKLHLFMALDLQAHEAHPDEDEWLAVVHVPLEALRTDILANRCKDSKTLAAFLLSELTLIKADGTSPAEKAAVQ